MAPHVLRQATMLFSTGISFKTPSSRKESRTISLNSVTRSLTSGLLAPLTMATPRSSLSSFEFIYANHTHNNATLAGRGLQFGRLFGMAEAVRLQRTNRRMNFDVHAQGGDDDGKIVKPVCPVNGEGILLAHVHV